MGLLDKVKNFFYDEEEIEDEYEETMPIKIHHKDKKVKEKVKFKEIEKQPEDKQEISERELFKAERTFNFPMDIYDEEEKTSSIKIEKEEITNISSEKVDKPVSKAYMNTNTTKIENPYSNIRSYAKYEEKKEEKDVKKFKPTPVISPIYGILDKNYTKEDVIIDNASYEKPKKVDYDEVRKKAYKDVYKDEEEKGIFYNLDEEKNDETEEDVKIVYNDVTYDEEENDENMTIGQKIEKYEKEELANQIDDYESDYVKVDNDDTIDDDSNILSETKEQDLFNLIDNMYNSDDEEDE